MQNDFVPNILKQQLNSFIKCQVKRMSFSSYLNIPNKSAQDKKMSQQMLFIQLDKPPSQRSQQDIQITTKLLKEQNLFPEFRNSLNILKFLSKQIRLKCVYNNQTLSSIKTKDENLYKLLKGEVNIKKDKDTIVTIKNKGEFVEKFEQFRQTKDYEVKCKDECCLIAINYRQYREAVKMDKQNKAIMEMLVKTAIFSKFKRKQLFCVFQSCSQIQLTGKQILFSEGDTSNGNFYFVIDGELAVYKNNHLNKKQLVCYITSGNLIGEQVLFDQTKPRLYTVSAQSTNLKFLQINNAKLLEIIKHFELNLQQIFNKKYQDFLLLRQKHYISQLEQNSEVKHNFQPVRHQSKMSPIKHQQISNMLKDVDNMTMQLNQKEKLLQKRYQMGKDYKDYKIISIERPLFGKEDFPNLKQVIKRYGINEAKSKENCCKLPLL